MKKGFRLFPVIFFLLVLGQHLSAQTSSSKYIGNDGVARFFELRDNDGTLIKTASEMGATGTPMLRNGWGYGVIHYQNGMRFSDTAMNFSLFDNKLFYTREKKLFTIVLPVESFSLTFLEDGYDSVTYHFKSGFPAVDDHDAGSFYEVLFEGENLQLLQWHHKKVKDVFNYGNVREKEFALEQQLYVYLPKEKTMEALKPAINAIAKTLPAYSGSIHEWSAAHKFNAKNKGQVIDLVAYLDKKH